MENLLNAEVLSRMVENISATFLSCPFSYGLLLGAVLEVIGYGIFKAVSLININ